MLLYLVLSPPLFAVLLSLFYRVTQPRYSATVFLHGALVAVVLLLPWWLLTGSWEPTYTPAGLYGWYLARHMLYPLLPALGLFFLLERRLSAERGHIVVVAMAAFLAGTFFVQSVVDVLRIPHHYSGYVAFLLPSMRLGLIAAIPALLGAASREPRPVRLLFGAGVVLLPAAYAAIAMIYHLSFSLPAYLLAALGTGLAVLLHLVVLGNYYPRREQAFSFARRAPRRAGDAVPPDDETGGHLVTEVSGHPVRDV